MYIFPYLFFAYLDLCVCPPTTDTEGDGDVTSVSVSINCLLIDLKFQCVLYSKHFSVESGVRSHLGGLM